MCPLPTANKVFENLGIEMMQSDGMISENQNLDRTDDTQRSGMLGGVPRDFGITKLIERNGAISWYLRFRER